MLDLTKDNFDETLANSNFLFVDVWAEWCAPCKKSTPIFEQLADKFGNDQKVFVKLDAQNEMEVASKIGVMNLPTFVIFQEGKMIKKWAGADIPRLRKEIESVAK